MRITKHQLVAGYPALKVRAFLRRYRVGTFMVPGAEDALQVNAEQAAELMAQLVALGLIEPVEPKTVLAESGFELTSRGEAFASASAAKPVFRKTAEHFCSSSWSASTLSIPILTTLTGSKAPFFSAACSLKSSGSVMWTSPSNCYRRSLRSRNFGSCVTGADMRRESTERASDPVLTGSSGQGRRFLKRFGRGRVPSACTEFMTLPKWWMCNNAFCAATPRESRH